MGGQWDYETRTGNIDRSRKYKDDEDSKDRIANFYANRARELEKKERTISIKREEELRRRSKCKAHCEKRTEQLYELAIKELIHSPNKELLSKFQNKLNGALFEADALYVDARVNEMLETRTSEKSTERRREVRRKKQGRVNGGTTRTIFCVILIGIVILACVYAFIS